MGTNARKRTARQEQGEASYHSECFQAELPESLGRVATPTRWTEIFSISRLDGTRVLTIERACIANDEIRQESEPNRNDDFKQPQDIVITKLDRERIKELLVSVKPDLNIEMLKAELDRATIVSSEAISPNVVTMNSRVRFEDMTTKDETEFTLAYPQMANIDAGRVSILSPVGAALLGLKTGDEIEWPLPLGRKRTLKIISIPYQPEAQGNFDL